MLRIKKLYPDVVDPVRVYPNDSGLDLCAYLPDGDLIIKPLLDPFYKDLATTSVIVPTGIAIKLPESKIINCSDSTSEVLIYEGHIRPRSGLSAKYSISAHFGTIDNTYTGEIKVILFNFSNKSFTITHGMRIAQLIIAPIIIPRIVFVDDLEKQDRGSDGFGSTGLTELNKGNL